MKARAPFEKVVQGLSIGADLLFRDFNDFLSQDKSTLQEAKVDPDSILNEIQREMDVRLIPLGSGEYVGTCKSCGADNLLTGPPFERFVCRLCKDVYIPEQNEYAGNDMWTFICPDCGWPTLIKKLEQDTCPDEITCENCQQTWNKD